MELFKTLAKVFNLGASVLTGLAPILIPMIFPKPTPGSLIEELEKRFAEINKLLEEILEKQRKGELKI